MSRELELWIDDLGKAGDELHQEAKHVVEKGALNVKKDWRERWLGHSHIPELPWAVTYDIVADEETVISYEIGPDKAKPQGPLGNIIEFGTLNNAPIPGGMPALEAEEPRFTRAVADLGVQLLTGTS